MNKNRDRSSIRLAVVAMIRNEGDIIVPFLRQCAELFDKLLVADIQSTDGTAAALHGFTDPRLEVQVYEVERQEKFQSALMNCFSREAFAQGADWVFFLDADEFLDVPDRGHLQRHLKDSGSDVLLSPWVNLVPSRYGTYNSFDVAQTFRWSGRTSKWSKVAVSSLFAANNLDYHILEGSHSVALSPSPTAPPIGAALGPALLHVPIRSIDRFKVKIGSARRLEERRHNRAGGEGQHVFWLDDLLTAGRTELAELNYMAANYGEPMEETKTVLPAELAWPEKRLPAYVADTDGQVLGQAGVFASLSETLLADERVCWDRTKFVKGTPVAALIEGERIRIVPQPIHGGGAMRRHRYSGLGPVTPVKRPPEELLIDVVSAACTRITAWVSSAWSELIPVINALFVLLRPRRFVELGAHNGMSFFAACQIVERVGLATECVAIDSWEGDEHAGLYDTSVFEGFRTYLGTNYAQQQYIQAYFSAARGCFEDGSIDLLHIDGLHTYEAVKDDFQTWLPCMSDVGVVIFHDINVFERGFGVWRLWEELKAKYPAFSFSHKHGLGIIFVGREPHVAADLLRALAGNRHYGTLAQAFFEAVGTLLIEHRGSLAELEDTEALRQQLAAVQHQYNSAASDSEALRQQLAVVQHQYNSAASDSEALRQQLAAVQHQYSSAFSDSEALRQQLATVQHQSDTILNSASWRATAPVRTVLHHMSGLPILARHTEQLARWTVTGQLARRLRERRERVAARLKDPPKL
jgi:hypothetical protein